MAINKEYLDNAFREVIKTAPEDISPLSLLGATPLKEKTTELVSYTMGGSSTVFEGQVKPVTETSQRSYEVLHAKQVITLVATEEAVENDFEGVVRDLSSKAYSRLVSDMDSAILTGTDRNGHTPTNLYLAALSNKAGTMSMTGDNVVESGDLLTALRSVNSSKAGIVLSYDAWADINYAQKDGQKLYPQSTPDGTFDFFGAQALLVPGYRYNTMNEYGEFETSTRRRALIGDFSRVHRSIHGYKTKVSDEATVNGVSMFETNQVSFQFEIFYSFTILVDRFGPTKFISLLKF